MLLPNVFLKTHNSVRVTVKADGYLSRPNFNCVCACVIKVG